MKRIGHIGQICLIAWIAAIVVGCASSAKYGAPINPANDTDLSAVTKRIAVLEAWKATGASKVYTNSLANTNTVTLSSGLVTGVVQDP